ncbi:hypothetical protein MAR_014839 [Mya arenaria]|uniref:Uncharacterized protein n=1 Tax=Mya arenaria TaxID=6604 RepID=A0ABY7FFM1_MYAAR|nr:hypothetical protein MAR_014839 [Mya arenaria]
MVDLFNTCAKVLILILMQQISADAVCNTNPDTLPTVSDGFVNRTVCVSSLVSSCDANYSVNVKYCGFYYVYCLWELPNGCPQRFCFGAVLCMEQLSRNIEENKEKFEIT